MLIFLIRKESGDYMMFDEIVKTLRDYVLKDAMTKKVRLVISEAVDLIESQQEEIKRLKEHLTSVEQCDIMTLTDCDFCVNLREIMQENKRLRTELDETSDAETKLQLDNIRLESENKWIKAERDAAVADIPHNCATCIHLQANDAPRDENGFHICKCGARVSILEIQHAEKCHWEWRGRKEQNDGTTDKKN